MMVTKRELILARFASMLAVFLALVFLLSGCSATIPLIVGAAGMMQGTTSIRGNLGSYKAGLSVTLPKLKFPTPVIETPPSE